MYKEVNKSGACRGDNDGDHAHRNKWYSFFNRFSEGGAGDLGGYENTHCKWRSEEANAHVNNQNGAEVDGGDAVGLGNRQQQRGHDKDGSVNIHEGSHEQEQHIDQNKEGNTAVNVGDDQVGEEVGNTGQGHGFASHGRECIEQAYDGSCSTGNGAAFPEGNGNIELLGGLCNNIVENTVDTAECAGFGNSADTAVDAAVDQNGHKQCGQSLDGAAAQLSHLGAKSRVLSGYLGLMACNAEIVDDKVANHEDECRADGCHPYLGDLGAGGQCIHNTGDAGRNQNSKEAGSSQQSGSIASGVAVLMHLGSHNIADGADGSHCRSGKYAKGHAGHGGNNAGGAADMANE